MKKLTVYTALFLLLAAFGIEQAQAQTTFSFGPRAGYELDNLEAFQLGADLRLSNAALPVDLNPTFDYFFLDDKEYGSTDIYQVNVNALYNFGVNNQMFTPYVGAGLALTRVSNDNNSDTETGANILAGAKFGFGAAQPFLQVQTVLGGNNATASVVGGLLFNLGR